MLITNQHQRSYLPNQVVHLELNAETSPPIFVPPGTVGLEVLVTSGAAYFQQTSCDEIAITAGTNHWFDWPLGIVASPATNAVVAATAVRCVATGAATFYVRW